MAGRILGVTGRTVSRATATMSVLDEATGGAYSAGDLIANSTTAASVVPITFNIATSVAPSVSGKITGCRCVIAPASSTLVITACDIDLLLFRPATGIPFVAGSYPADNAALAVTAAMMRELVSVFSFVNGAWRNPAGALTAGAAGYQAVVPASGRAYSPFNLSDLSGATTLLGLLQAKAAWTPTHIVQRFDFALDIELD